MNLGFAPPGPARAYVALRPAPHRPRPDRLTVGNVRRFHARAETVEDMARAFEKEGFTVTGRSPLGISVAAPRELVGGMFASFLLPAAIRPTAPVVPPHLACLVDHVRTPPRVRFFGPPGASAREQPQASARRLRPSPDAPPLPYYHLDVPEDVARLMDARAAHDHGFTGAGVRVGVIDTGFHPHEWYGEHGFHVTLAGDNHPERDEIGHGTGIITNALAVAPGAHFIGVKLDDDAAAAVQRAKAEKPQVISCSWGLYVFDRDLHDEIVDAVAGGITVCFAAGNGPGGASWPGAMPEVVSVGGIYVDERGRLEASSYASSGLHAAEPGRRCPDVCGLTGEMPMGIYIAMPTQEGSELDREFAAGGTRFPEGDATKAADGWLAASGTSSATPAVAGVAALILEAEPGLSPEEVKDRLRASCRDVVEGASANADKTGRGPDAATGAGLVDALVAVHPVDLWVKDSPSDNGTVPDTYPAAWTSPDIWIRREDDHGLDAGHGPTPGEANWVYVRVRNRGRAPARDVTVRLFWTGPELHVPWPAGWRTDGLKVDGVSGNARAIPEIPAGGEAVTEAFEWWPPAASDLGLPAGDSAAPGLLARVECPDDPVAREGDVPGDNNLAGRVVFESRARPGEEKWFTVGVARPKGRRGTAALVLDREGLPRAVKVALEPDLSAGQPPAVPAIADVGDTVVAQPLDLVSGARQRVRVGVKVPAEAEPGRLVVRLDETIGGVPVGHASLVVRVSGKK